MKIVASEIGEVKFFAPVPRRLRVDLAGETNQPDRYRICFNEGNNRGVYPGETSFLGFRRDSDRLQISGMWVDPMARGTDLSYVLVETGFILADVLQVPLRDTAIIRKPLLASFLGKLGFSPVSTATQVQLLPRSEGSTVPKVRMRSSKQAFPGSTGWFELEEGPFLDEDLPVVSIYTPYELKYPDLLNAVRSRVHEQLDGRIRIFKNRVDRMSSK